MTTLHSVPLAWRDGPWLVLRRREPVAPDRCIVTNELVFGPSKITRKLSWGNNGPTGSWMPTKLQMFWALADMKTISVTFGLSGKVRSMRLIVMLLALASIAGGGWLFVQGLKQGFPPQMTYLGGCAALVVIALTLFANTYSTIDIVSMDHDFVWLRGAKKPFLDSLPAFQHGNRPNYSPEPTPSVVR